MNTKPKKQCLTKKKHLTKLEAEHAMFKNHGNNQNYNVYRCPHCAFWHVGHKPEGINE